MLSHPCVKRPAYSTTQGLGARPQRGMMLIEAMVSILLLMLGILGIAGLTAKSTALSGQAQYRTEAGMYAAQIIHLMSLSVDRSSPTALAQSLEAFAHQAGGSGHCSRRRAVNRRTHWWDCQAPPPAASKWWWKLPTTSTE